jgi:hypothetical protein
LGSRVGEPLKRSVSWLLVIEFFFTGPVNDR